MQRAFRRILLLALVAGCTEASAPTVDQDHDDKPMPEATEPIVQALEDGPIGEGLLVDVTESETIVLPRASSRATVWLTLADPAAATPDVVVQPGWENGRTGAWTTLEEVHAEGAYRVLAIDLDTAATRLRFRVSQLVPRLRWAASVPLDPALFADVADADPIATARAAWMADAARCGSTDGPPTEVVLHLRPGPGAGEDPAAYLRALQAHDRIGLGWCDVRPNHLVTDGASWTGRGSRRAAIAPTSAANEGLVAVSVLGCEDTAGARTALATLLDQLTAAHGFMSADRFRVGASAMCADDAWLDDALSLWLETAPFVPPPPPPETEGTLSGRVLDSTDDAPIAGATVRCECGVTATTDAAGAYAMTLEAGMYAIQVEATDYVTTAVAASIQAEQTTSLDVRLDPEQPQNPGVSVIDHSFLITLWGGNDVDPLQFPETQEGFQQYLDAVGVTHFAAWEYVVPNNETVAANCGYTILLPERSWWRKGAALGLLADQLRALVNEPVTLRNWWRPPCYNEGVGGAPSGDHPDGDALDLDFRSNRSRADAQRYLCETFWLQDIVAPEDIAPGSNLNPRLNMSVGLGGVTIHLGLLSRNGRRYWQYSSYTNESNSGTCW